MTTESIVDGALGGLATLSRTDAWQRQDWLIALADAVTADADPIAAAIHADTGKPDKWTRIEVERAVQIIRLAAAEALHLHPQTQQLDGQPSGSGRLAITLREPRGPVLALSPFNFPLHLTVHKVAPAIAAGASIVVIGSPRTPRTATALAHAVTRAGIPDGIVTVVRPDADHRRTWELITHPAVPVVSFTGSDAVGRRIVDAVPRKQVVVELGGNAAAVIAPDATSPDDLRHAAERIALFGFYNAGQACTSVQRVYVPESTATTFVPLLLAATREQDHHADVGPVIDDASADRIRAWVAEAVAGGARLATGGPGEGRLLPPTVLLDPPPTARVVTEEVFGPVVSVLTYTELDDAFAQVNDSRYGLSSGVFTHDLRTASRAVSALRTGQVVIGDVPTYRSDVTPFGGIKDSGRGREGVRATIDDYTVSRTAVFAEPPVSRWTS
ncbi:aldehyde dehydrogenase family protein [Gordonia sp. NPDC003376]